MCVLARVRGGGGGDCTLRFSQHVIILTVLAVLQPSVALVDCRTACRKCHEKSEPDAVLEVYCAMCEECKQRRREKLQARTSAASTDTTAPPSQPTVQPSPDDDNTPVSVSVPWTRRTPPTVNHNYDYMRLPLRNNAGHPQEGCPTPPPCSDSNENVEVEKLSLHAVSTTAAPPPTPCPPITTCKKKLKRHPRHPCSSVCPCPGSGPAAAATEKEYHLLYVGVPKNLLRGI